MPIATYIDTHCHLDGEEFAADREAVVQRAREAGCARIFLPAIDVKSCHTVLDVCAHYPGYCYPMLVTLCSTSVPTILATATPCWVCIPRR